MAYNYMNSEYYKKVMKNDFTDELNHYNFLRTGKGYSDVMVKGLPYIFISTPVLNLNNANLNRSEFFSYMRDQNHGLLKTLNYAGYGTFGGGEGDIPYYSTSPFIKLLSNKFISVDLKDTTSEPKAINETFYGYKQNLPSTSIASLTADELTVNFQETKDAGIIKIFKVWTDYIEKINRGTMMTSPRAKRDKIIDYTSSIYYFLLDFDGESIQYYAKYTGCSPLNVPYSNFQQGIGDSHDAVTIPINFTYGYKEDMDPAILSDFNTVSTKAADVISKKGDPQNLIYSDSIGNMSKSETLTEDFDQDQNFKPIVSLGNYGDNKDKFRYKLKFV